MAPRVTLPIPRVSASPVDGNGAFDPTFYFFLAALKASVDEQVSFRTMVSSSAAPTTSTLPEGQWVVWENTTAGTVKLYVNHGGTIKSVALS